MSKEMQNARDMESRVAEIMGGKLSKGPSSVPGVPDIITPKFIVECKHRKDVPNLVTESMTQVEKFCDQYAPKLPVVVLHEKRKSHLTDYAIMRLKDFQDVFIFEGMKEGLE